MLLVIVDTADHIITHIQAFHADKGDGQCFTEVLKHTANNLSDNGLKMEEVIADAGYSSEPALLALIRHQVEGFIPNKKGFINDRAGFTYEAENDRYKCPEGKYLTFRHFRIRGESTHKLYKTNVKDCKDCPFKQTCTNPSIGIKVIRDSSVKQLYAQMAHRVQSTKGQKMRKIRAGTVEPVIGTLVNFTAMKKVNTKGIALANKCMIMAAVAYNLKKLLKARPAPGKNSPNDTLTTPFEILHRQIAILFAQMICLMMALFKAYRKGQTTYWSFALYL
ncbi:transposase [Mucilaginibacter sabulilitoris]|uniref:Transposase n=1 Tax=Mucilaginibacter sabulilitoris TaxID=1173583 RepID=A0ABZ0TJW0_9SPHI|nr:transposase [Mucilaginibacter sabulilitoris]WPU92976.1 transposase [Mucilaginibacter sabulilitoris]